MMLSSLLEEALRVATTDEFSADRLRQLKALYDKAQGSDKEKIGELSEVFLVLAQSEQDREAVDQIWT